MPPVINIKKCRCTGKAGASAPCIYMCPGNCLHLDEKKQIPVVVYPEECWHCGNCRLSCPENAITLVLSTSMLL